MILDKYNHKLNLVANTLQTMTALSLELMDLTGDWVSSFVVLFQAFTAADFSCCLFACLSSISFVFSKWNACSIGLRSGDWLGHCGIFHLLTFKHSWVAFALCLGSLSICTMKWRPINFAWSSSINTSNRVPLEAMHAHAIPLLHHVSQMMLHALDHELFQVFSRLFSSRHSSTGWS